MRINGEKGFFFALAATGWVLVSLPLAAWSDSYTPAKPEQNAPAEKQLDPKLDPRMDCPVEWLEDIGDDMPVQAVHQSRGEYYAYNYFVAQARKFSPELLAEHSHPKVTFRHLFAEDRHQYRGQIVRVQGRLKRLNWIGTNKYLEDGGIKDLYEAWIFGEAYFSNPICVVLSELPPGIEPSEDIRNVWVTCDGYFFKRYKYKAIDGTRLAPLVIGRTVTQITPENLREAEHRSRAWGFFVPALLCLLFGMIVFAFVVHRWFLKGDQKTYARLTDARPTEYIAPTDPLTGHGTGQGPENSGLDRCRGYPEDPRHLQNPWG